MGGQRELRRHEPERDVARLRPVREPTHAYRGYSDADTNCNSNRNGHRHPDCNGDSDPDSDSDTNCHSHNRAYTDSDANDNTATYSYSTAPSDTKASSVTVTPQEVLTRELERLTEPLLQQPTLIRKRARPRITESPKKKIRDEQGAKHP